MIAIVIPPTALLLRPVEIDPRDKRFDRRNVRTRSLNKGKLR